MKPAAKIGITRFGVGVVPSIIKSWKEGRRGGYVVNRTVLARRCSNRTTAVFKHEKERVEHQEYRLVRRFSSYRNNFVQNVLSKILSLRSTESR
jgi:hypothetical protein